MQRQSHDLDADGTRIRLWERSPRVDGDNAPDAAVLFVHGATYPGRVVFDLDTPAGYSWLARVAARGRAAFAVDLRGYGDSARPAAMDAPPDQNPPPARADTVVADVRAALAHVGERFDRVHLVGYSWGSLVCGRLLAATDGPPVASLTQFAPVFRMEPATVERFDPGDPAPAYRTVTREEVRSRWDEQVPDGSDPVAWRGGDADDPVFDAFWTQLSATGQGVDGSVRAPNGTLLDLRETVDAAPYDPASIAVPTLVVRGGEDPTATRADALRLYDALDGVREYAEVGGGTHFLPLEARRGALYDAVAGFHARV